jgi:hypothetical protein
MILTLSSDKDEEEDDDDDDDEEDNDEDEPAALMRELAKIKRERAEEQARKEREANAVDAERREEEIASANPLLNLQAALGKGGSASVGGSFAVKKRWDDGTVCHRSFIFSVDDSVRPYLQESSKWSVRQAQWTVCQRFASY